MAPEPPAMGPDLLWKAGKVAYRKWGLKGVVGMALAGAVLYLLWQRRLERFVEREPDGSEATPA